MYQEKCLHPYGCTANATHGSMMCGEHRNWLMNDDVPVIVNVQDKYKVTLMYGDLVKASSKVVRSFHLGEKAARRYVNMIADRMLSQYNTSAYHILDDGTHHITNRNGQVLATMRIAVVPTK